MGRPKRTGGRKVTFWLDDINREMIDLYAERNALDMTSSLNLLIRQVLTGMGLYEEAKQNVEARKTSEEDSDN